MPPRATTSSWRRMTSPPLSNATTARHAELALEAYQETYPRSQRDEWMQSMKTAIETAARYHRTSMQHVELIFPGSGEFLELPPGEYLRPLQDVHKLESLSIQWPLQAVYPLAQILDPPQSQAPANGFITKAYTSFLEGLTAVLKAHPYRLLRLRISLPQPPPGPDGPLYALRFTPKVLPWRLWYLEVLDLTHWSPPARDLIAVLADTERLPQLKHVIIDQGAPLPRSDRDISSDSRQYDDKAPERDSWRAVGTCLAARQPPLASFCAALHVFYRPGGRGGRAITSADLRELLGPDFESTPTVLCTTWPADSTSEDQGGHAEGCGHLAIPKEQRSRSSIWPSTPVTPPEDSRRFNKSAVLWY
ncbi:hypothetical protein MIND_00581300 [Mycena indigotica]|uniref:Uncharacterized protein n=1 Tax=Mycena indigotica TaxID=2126181 RepID=A0A8H6SRS1_9AGAR|nr:uncharacterized protein MIND_00581300 [Mycena indigotica]KAF7303521.1 hypothetical protein MIND_00581300 [Mycena indigotica]